jgi:hypothetical protein
MTTRKATAKGKATAMGAVEGVLGAKVEDKGNSRSLRVDNKKGKCKGGGIAFGGLLWKSA